MTSPDSVHTWSPLEVTIANAIAGYSDEPIRRLEAVREARRTLRLIELAEARRALAQGYGSRIIGRALGVSAQTAYRRHGTNHPRPRPLSD